MKNNDFIAVAKDYLKSNHKKAKFAFIAGSMLRGEGKPHSDIDLVILFDKVDLSQCYRTSVTHQGWPIEVFCQNENSYQFFLEKGKKIGRNPLAAMVADGMLFPEDNTEGLKLKQQAIEYIKNGPDSMSEQENSQMRYAINDMIDDLRDERNKSEYFGVLSELYVVLGSFYLKANGNWTGISKAIPRKLKNENEQLAFRYQEAFEQAFTYNNMQPVILLAEEILEPFGGLLCKNYKDFAPKEVNDYVLK